jgi:glycosyltransferase involved in cell wall biosynthesis
VRSRWRRAKPAQPTATLPHRSAPTDGACLMLGTAASIGGMERIMVTLAGALERQGHTVDLLFPAGADSDEFLSWARASKCRSVDVDPGLLDAASPHNLRSVIALGRVVRRGSHRVINIHYGDNFISLKDMLAIRAFRPFCRLVVTVHHPTEWSQTSVRKRVMSILAGSLAARVITVSEATADVVRKTPVRRSKVVRIPNGIDITDGMDDRRSARRELDLDDDDVAIVSVARLVPHKGLAELVDAVTELAEPRTVLLIVGDGPERANIADRAARSADTRIRMLGRVADVGRVMAGADLFALPSQLEGFGLVYLEAANHCLPSIAGAAGGAAEVIVDQRTGLLVQPGDVAGLVEALRQLCADPAQRRRMGAAAYRRLRAEFTSELMAARTASVFWPRSRR